MSAKGESLAAAIGEAGADHWIGRNEARTTVAEQGHFRAGDLTGLKPL